MSFAASVGEGALEYAGTSLATLFAQPANLFRPRFWSMLGDLLRFYRTAPGELAALEASGESLGAYLERKGYGTAFVEDHLLPMGAAIWSTPAQAMKDHPAAAFIAFCNNHGLLQLKDRPRWRTVVGGSRVYVQRLLEDSPGLQTHLNARIAHVRRVPGGVVVEEHNGDCEFYDHVVLAVHGDQALAMLQDPDEAERRLLSAFPYQRNLAFLHRDESLMPRRRSVWSSWNYLSSTDEEGKEALCVSYWMNRLQPLGQQTPDLFVTLNPPRPPRRGTVLRTIAYEHPLFDQDSWQAQRQLWSLQGQRNTWFCGAWFGAGFHEDGLQAGLAVAEHLGGLPRPWTVDHPSGRIFAPPARALQSGESTR